MEEVGPIKLIKLVLNRETGAHRGYGFVEYHSLAVAKSAMQNLAGRELMGRKIRVDSAGQNAAAANKNRKNKNNHGGGGGGRDNNNGGGEFGGNDFSGGARSRVAAPQRQQRQQPHQVSAGPSQHEAVRSALQQLTVYQIYDVLKQMKVLCQERPQIAEEILLNRPPLAQALLQAQHMFGMVHETIDGLELPKADHVEVSNRGGRSASAQRQPLPPQNSLARPGKKKSNNHTNITVPNGHPPLLSSLPTSMPSHPMPSQPLSQPTQPPPQIKIAPPGTRLIQGFDEPVPEHFVQQALHLTPAQVAGLNPDQQRLISMIRSSFQQQQQYAPPPSFPYGR